MTSSESTDGLNAIIKQIKDKKHPPVHLWNPDFCGDLDMKIARDGTWYYMGSPIGRMPLVKLFSSVLRLDDDKKYYLVTPVEKIGIIVEDAPFVAVEMFREGEGRSQILSFRTHVDEYVVVDEAHPLRISFDEGTGEPSPYVMVRSNLEALIARSVFYDLIELSGEEEIDGNIKFGVWSRGVFFEFGSVDEIFGE
ncbi:proteophosphoglycan precursor [Alphaproteobacteria bacterium 46_93_T64]|nr:proteophosphoglycan precursor [Alphaproteobacteria bacterium 46_93_T64]